MTRSFEIPPPLAANRQTASERRAWLDRLPDILDIITSRWALLLLAPFPDASCAWVAPVMRTDGSSAVLKIGMPHMEAAHEALGLQFWEGDPTVRLLDVDEELGVMLMERCQPGTALRTLPEHEQDVVMAGLLRRLWREPSPPHVFRPLSRLLQHWTEETLSAIDRWPDAGLVRAGLGLFQDLANSALVQVLLATDLHAGNVVRAEREPWLIIDPKPFVGDPVYDLTQHLFNCEERLRLDPDGLIRRMADLVCIDPERLRLWMFARAAADPRDKWDDVTRWTIARALAP